eukprot:TRINITY_DN8484_c0_g1_i1.p1 TRINITY_DN8484_c0_g1~~TRINITY_DN8484_c0_g1_i1.p1  ORF type:complete len:275 (-),score=73.96 TRINITY_DN8484_c0_g1_i1:72-896(-)
MVKHMRTRAMNMTESWTAVKEANVFGYKNKRRRMEDAHTLVDTFGGLEHQAFFGVYDGHLTPSAAVFTSENLHESFLELLQEATDENLADEEYMENLHGEAYEDTDQKMKEVVPAAGACVVTALIRQVGDERYIYVANAGDSRAVIVKSSGEAEMVTIDHKPSLESEIERIKEAGGYIDKGRVNGTIAVTRALGDHCLKPRFIINTPHFYMRTLEEDDKYLLLACDGVWDALTTQEAADILDDDIDCLELCKNVIRASVKGGSDDNISVIVVRL